MLRFTVEYNALVESGIDWNVLEKDKYRGVYPFLIKLRKPIVCLRPLKVFKSLFRTK